jgi:hypothetical protein
LGSSEPHLEYTTTSSYGPDTPQTRKRKREREEKREREREEKERQTKGNTTEFNLFL